MHEIDHPWSPEVTARAPFANNLGFDCIRVQFYCHPRHRHRHHRHHHLILVTQCDSTRIRVGSVCVFGTIHRMKLVSTEQGFVCFNKTADLANRICLQDLDMRFINSECCKCTEQIQMIKDEFNKIKSHNHQTNINIKGLMLVLFSRYTQTTMVIFQRKLSHT